MGVQVTTTEVFCQTRCQFLELRRVSTVVTLRTRSWRTSTRIDPQHATPVVPIIRMPDFWPHAALEAQFKVHRIDRQDLRNTILNQWLTEEIAICFWRSRGAYVKYAIHRLKNGNFTPNKPREVANLYQEGIYGTRVDGQS